MRLIIKKTGGILALALLALLLLAACGGGGTAQPAPDTEHAGVEQSSTDALPAEMEEPVAADTATDADSLWVSVVLEGGSGKVSVASPVQLRPEADGTYTAVLCWSSPNYDYMVVDGETYRPVNTEGNSVFEIPVPAAQCVLQVQADTVAMSQPHLIDYTLTFGADGTAAENQTEAAATAEELPALSGLTYTGSMELSYARQFTADYYEGGLTLVTIAGADRFLLVSEGGNVPSDLPDDITVIQQPLNRIYMVASGLMDMFAACDGMDSLGFCALEQDDWYVDAARTAMEAGDLVYAGKYSAPDYEQLTAGNCSLAVENTMVLHSPEVVEKLESLGIPVIIEHSSYEETPQGRMEWVKLCGVLTGHIEEAERVFQEQLAEFQALENAEKTGKTVAFFYVTTSGTVSVRNASDYIPRMIVLAGGDYAFPTLGQDSANATTALQMEEFYAQARDADILIYNSTIAGELDSLADFTAISPLFADMKAVKNGAVWCTGSNVYQSSMELGSMVTELHTIFTGGSGELTYFTHLN